MKPPCIVNSKKRDSQKREDKTSPPLISASLSDNSICVRDFCHDNDDSFQFIVIVEVDLRALFHDIGKILTLTHNMQQQVFTSGY